MNLPLVAQIVGFSFAAGVNLYATVAVIGLASRFGWVALPPQLAVFDHDLVIAMALAMYVIEFFADKIPWVDTAWDTVHTFVRPLGAALIAVTALGEASPVTQGMVALLGGTIAAGSHVGKAGARVLVNTSPEPFSNWALSLLEDGLVVTLGLIVLAFPVASLVFVGLLGAVMVWFAAALMRAVRRRVRHT